MLVYHTCKQFKSRKIDVNICLAGLYDCENVYEIVNTVKQLQEHPPFEWIAIAGHRERMREDIFDLSDDSLQRQLLRRNQVWVD